MSLSRSAALAAILIGTLVGITPARAESPPVERYRQLTSVEPRCNRPSNDREILVCGARRADRWRVPFIGYDAGDPRAESVEGERKRISAAPVVPCGQGAIIANCGKGVGMSATTAFGASGGELRLRPLAP